MNDKVAVLVGSKNDLEYAAAAEEMLARFEVPCEVRVLSAHRTPDETADFARGAEANGFAVIIACAGMAAALPGVVAAHTILPVIGVPLPTSEVRGMDALFAIVQMPAGVPVATMAIGRAGARNAAILAVEILARGNPGLRDALLKYRQDFS